MRHEQPVGIIRPHSRFIRGAERRHYHRAVAVAERQSAKLLRASTSLTRHERWQGPKTVHMTEEFDLYEVRHCGFERHDAKRGAAVGIRVPVRERALAPQPTGRIE
jgi:hypothetical protein